MMVLITYDVNTQTAEGQKHLRKVAKACVNYGIRVQNSVFECVLDGTQLCSLKAILGEIIDDELDSVRFYHLGNNYQKKVEEMGKNNAIHVEEVLLL
ncbi:CRISPR-associated endonuclease Cas2 [Eubacterium aggregans]|uniref:CRISPR-associated endonuclease Cas2 n=1 Tax=Eubacterium aggregans TaxID=81409 RepID=UPI003F410D43